MKNHLPYNRYLDKEQQLNMITFMAAVHCLLDYLTGEVAGMMTGEVLGWSNFETVALAIRLAFLSLYFLIILFILLIHRKRPRASLTHAYH